MKCFLKKSAHLLLLALIPITVISQHSNYSIRGKINGLREDVNIFLIRNDIDNGKFDTASQVLTKKGEFTFDGKMLREGNFFFLDLEGKNRALVRLFLDCDTIYITCNVDEWPKVIASNSQANSDFNSYSKLNSTTNEFYDSVSESLKSLLKYISNETNKKHQENRKEFIINHRNSTYTPYLILGANSWSIEEKQLAYENLTEKAKNSYYGLELKKYLELKNAANNAQVGKMAPNFTLLTPEKKSLSLFEVVSKSKITLLDFWASWCGPCRQHTPDIKRLYDKFHKKGFNIISVSLDYKHEYWKRAIDSDKMNWYHVSDLKHWKSYAASLYNVTHAPCYFLLDASGKILKADLGFKELEETINKYF